MVYNAVMRRPPADILHPATAAMATRLDLDHCCHERRCVPYSTYVFKIAVARMSSEKPFGAAHGATMCNTKPWLGILNHGLSKRTKACAFEVTIIVATKGDVCRALRTF